MIIDYQSVTRFPSYIYYTDVLMHSVSCFTNRFIYSLQSYKLSINLYKKLDIVSKLMALLLSCFVKR